MYCIISFSRGRFYDDLICATLPAKYLNRLEEKSNCKDHHLKLNKEDLCLKKQANITDSIKSLLCSSGEWLGRQNENNQCIPSFVEINDNG